MKEIIFFMRLFDVIYSISFRTVYIYIMVDILLGYM